MDPVKNNAAVAAFLSSCAETGTGGVVGGTAWTFANEGTIPRRSLDLLVVDEAGQFSLAPTIASSIAATRLLLLGDPQQLPQVSQGSHPEPVDQSALGWLADGEHVLPAEFGYFLARTRRMEPALTAAVSGLSYDGQLASMVSGRHLDGIDPGVHPVPVVHAGNTTSSVEEAERVVALARDVVGRTWTDGDTSRVLTDEDVIVVAPYNAQGAVIREALDAAGSAGRRSAPWTCSRGARPWCRSRRSRPRARRTSHGVGLPAHAEPVERGAVPGEVGGVPRALTRADHRAAAVDRRTVPALPVHRARRAPIARGDRSAHAERAVDGAVGRDGPVRSAHEGDRPRAPVGGHRVEHAGVLRQRREP